MEQEWPMPQQVLWHAWSLDAWLAFRLPILLDTMGQVLDFPMILPQASRVDMHTVDLKTASPAGEGRRFHQVSPRVSTSGAGHQ